ncbi:MAG: TetR/AcrR family transcriptional regulator [Chitinophagales bacterium]
MPVQKVSLDFIIRQSLKVFRKKGYHNTSMEDLADACGLKKGSLYHYFKGEKGDNSNKGKMGMMKAVIKYLHDYYKREAFVHAYDKKLGAEQRLRILGSIAEEHYFASDSGCLFGNLALEAAGSHEELEGLVKAFFEDFINALRTIFEEKFEPKMALEHAEQSLAEIEGAVMMMRVFDKRDYLIKANQQILKRFRKG